MLKAKRWKKSSTKKIQREKKKVQEEIEKKAHADARFVLPIVQPDKVLKKKNLASCKKTKKEDKKAYFVVKKLATQVNKNSPGSV